MKENFEWDPDKNLANIEKHGISFGIAQKAFLDPERIILLDHEHSEREQRFFCIGRLEDGILTVRFTMREDVFRIFGAGFWRTGRRIYEEKNNLHG